MEKLSSGETPLGCSMLASPPALLLLLLPSVASLARGLGHAGPSSPFAPVPAWVRQAGAGLGWCQWVQLADLACCARCAGGLFSEFAPSSYCPRLPVRLKEGKGRPAKLEEPSAERGPQPLSTSTARERQRTPWQAAAHVTQQWGR